MTIGEHVALVLMGGGAAFFLAGTIGLLRFPDVYCRLHALTKADNLGLGLVVLGLVVQADSWSAALKLALIWALVLLSSTTACHLTARAALEHRVPVWRRS